MSVLNHIRDVLARSAETKPGCFDAHRGFGRNETAVVCIGNTLKADDGAAVVLCEKLSGKIAAELIDAGTVPENYIQPLIKKNFRTIILIDTVDFGGRAGEINLFSAEDVPAFAASTHTMSLRLFADMLRSESRACIHLIGIQPENVGLEMKLSAPVNKAVEQLAQLFIENLPPANI